MTEIPIAGDRGIVQLRTGVLHVQWIPGLAICEEAALAVMAAVNELSRGARRVFALPSTVARVALLGSSPVDRAIANFFLSINAPAAPTRYFTCPTAAMAWLRET